MIENRRTKKQIREERFREIESWPEVYRNASRYIKDNLVYSQDSHYININFGKKKTIEGLTRLSQGDDRNDEQIRDWLKSEKDWSEFIRGNYGLTSFGLGFHRIGGVDSFYANDLVSGGLALRLTSDKTLGEYILRGGIYEKTFVDWDDPLYPYTPVGIYEDRCGLCLKVEESLQKYPRLIRKHLFDRELKKTETK